MSQMPNKPLRYVACVSYPRSGHHLAVRIFRQYFRSRFRYCQYYVDLNGDCCGEFPCSNEQVTMTKNHDMGLGKHPEEGIPKVDGVPYLILVRNFLEAVVSDYNLFLRGNEDSESAWVAFARQKSVYYQRFVQKWIADTDSIEKLVVRYEDLTSEPIEAFQRCIQFFQPGERTDTERLAAVIQGAVLEDARPDTTVVVRDFGVRARRDIKAFPHYRAEFFQELEDRLENELKLLGYRLRYAA